MSGVADLRHLTLLDGVQAFWRSAGLVQSDLEWVKQVGLSDSYRMGDPFVSVVWLMVLVSSLCFVLGLVMRNYSHVDRIWSIIPLVYCWHFLYHAWLNTGLLNERLVVMTALVTVWGVRLSYNFARKGGYSLTEEDYRWPELRKIITNRFLFEIFNLTFISFYQNALLLMITLPMYYSYLSVGVEWSWFDTLATGSFLFFLVLETVSDQQQWNYQTTKHGMIKDKKPLFGKYKVGFNHTGLFRYSRHPNFLGEMSIWWSFYLFSLSHTPLSLINQSVIGTILLTLLFQGSTNFTEGITARKYPEYNVYKKGTSCFFPLPSSYRPPYKNE